MSKKVRPKAKPRAKPPASSRSSRFWPGLIVGSALAAAAVHFGPTLYKEITTDNTAGTAEASASPPRGKPLSSTRNLPDAAATQPRTMPPAKASPRPESPTIPQPASAPPANSAAGPPSFRDPARAADLLTRLGMGESYPGSLLWKNTDSLGWNAFGVIATSGSPVTTTTAAAAGNSVTCLLESKRADRVEALRLIANIYQPNAGEATLAKFKSLTHAVLTETRCPGTREFLEAIDGRLSLQTTSASTRFTLSQSPLAPGTRWELVVESR